MQILLEDLGHESDICFNGQEAIDCVKKRFYDDKCKICDKYYSIILMDIDMPIKNGYVATKEIVEFLNTESLMKTSIIACTAFFSSSDVS